jgi:hypothetical protein
MRVLVNVLAVLLLIIGVGMTLINFALAILAMSHATILQGRLPPGSPILFIVVMSACTGTIGAFMAYRVWMHLRRPDAGTMRDVISFALYWTVLMGLLPLLGPHPYSALFLIVGLVVLRHVLVKRLTPQFSGIH